MRHTREVVISEVGRDEGKIFILTEMPAEEGELWASRALELLDQAFSLVRARDPSIVASAVAEAAAADKNEADSDAPVNKGMAGLAIKSRPFTLPTARALQDPSLDNLWDYIKFQPKDRSAPPQTIFRDPEACQIQEWRTRLKLRMEFLDLHTGFFSPANPSASKGVPAT